MPPLSLEDQVTKSSIRKLGVFSNVRRLLEQIGNPEKKAGLSLDLCRHYLENEIALAQTDPSHPFWPIYQDCDKYWKGFENMFHIASIEIHQYQNPDSSLGLFPGDFSQEESKTIKALWKLLQMRFK